MHCYFKRNLDEFGIAYIINECEKTAILETDKT